MLAGMHSVGMLSSDTETIIDMAYECLEGCEDLLKYHERHGTPSMLILTQHCPDVAQRTAALLRDRIEGKNVIEIGAGVGFLAVEMARYAKSVVAIEADPAWSWVFTRSLYRHKPTNLTWIFGSAEHMIGTITGDVAVILTHSGIEEMRQIGLAFAPDVLMPLQEPRRFMVDADGEVIVQSFKEEAVRQAKIHGIPHSLR